MTTVDSIIMILNTVLLYTGIWYYDIKEPTHPLFMLHLIVNVYIIYKIIK